MNHQLICGQEVSYSKKQGVTTRENSEMNMGHTAVVCSDF